MLQYTFTPLSGKIIKTFTSKFHYLKMLKLKRENVCRFFINGVFILLST